MSLLTEIRELEDRHLLAGILGFLSLVGPGFLIIYRYHPKLIEQLDVVKLLVFSSALTTPVLFANLVLVGNAQPKTQKSSLRAELLLAAFCTAGVLYTGVAASYIFHFSFLVMIKWAALLTFVFSVTARLAQRLENKKASSPPIPP